MLRGRTSRRQIRDPRRKGSLRPIWAILPALLLGGCSLEDLDLFPTTVDVTGTWNGTWMSSSGVGGAVTMTLSQDGSTVTGPGNFIDSTCFADGVVSGSLIGNFFSGQLTAGAISVDITGAVADGFSGAYIVPPGGTCTTGDFGTFELTRTAPMETPDLPIGRWTMLFWEEGSQEPVEVGGLLRAH